jgi:prepilin peptidase CpaA
MDLTHVALFSSFLCLCVAWDVLERRIPNQLLLVYVLFAFFLAARSWATLGAATVGACVGLGLLFLPFALGFVGAGDAKFFAVVGAFLGPSRTLQALVLGMAAGGFFALPLLYCRHMGLVAGKKATLPYALPLSLGALAALVCEWRGISIL